MRLLRPWPVFTSWAGIICGRAIGGSTATSIWLRRRSTPGRCRSACLLLSVSAATTLAEERDRGSLEVIMTTPLTAREIVWGKWCGTIATVPRLAILPIWVGIGAAMVSTGWDGLILMIGLILAYAAAITSFGLALATWVKRLGRVVVINVLTYVLIALGWPLVVWVLGMSVWSVRHVAGRAYCGQPVFWHLRNHRAGGADIVRDEVLRDLEPALASVLDRCLLRRGSDPGVCDVAHV